MVVVDVGGGGWVPPLKEDTEMETLRLRRPIDEVRHLEEIQCVPHNGSDLLFV